MSRDSRGPRRSEMDWRPPGWTYLPKRGIDRWLNDCFFALGEVMILAIPVSLALVTIGDPATTLGAIVSIVTMSSLVAVARNGRTRLASGWPGFRPATILARVCWYNAALAVAAYGGGAIDALVAPLFGSIVFAAVVSAGAVLALPRVAARTSALLAWWTWGRPVE